MKRIQKVLGTFLRRLGFFEYAVGLILVGIVGSVLYVKAAPASSMVVTVRLADKDLGWADNGTVLTQNVPPFEVGQKETDRFGRTTAEVVRAYMFEYPNEQNTYSGKKAAYVTFKLQGAFNASSGQYRYSGISFVAGDWVRFTFKSMVVNGMVVRVEDAGKWSPPSATVTVKTKIKSEDPPWGGAMPFTEVTGVEAYVADAIHVGDTVKDSEGNVLAEVLEKHVEPAASVATDANGILRPAVHPFRVDVYLTLSLRVRPVGDTLYYLEAVPVRVNARIPLYLPTIHAEARVTEMSASSN